MDELEKRLRDDAAAIDAGVSADWRARLDARLADTPRREMPVLRRRMLPLLAGGLAGALALAAYLVVSNPQSGAEAETSPLLVASRGQQPLAIDAVDLTEPLQQELHNLRADLQRARASIERDLRDKL